MPPSLPPSLPPALPSARSSGDAVADRRFAYAMAYRAAGETEAACELIAQALELAPGWAAGWLALGECQEGRGARPQAEAAYREALRLDPADAAGAGARLARLGAMPAQGALSPAHVAALFDDYAPRFEASLVGTLSYRGPALLRAAVDRLRPEGRFARAIDLGCGTGLSGEAFRDRCDRLEGVDLSARMLAAARAKGLYDALREADILADLGRQAPAGADLLLAADVFVYLGDLAPLFAAAGRALAPGGLFAFTAQSAPGPEAFRLGADLRYAHSAAALSAWAAAAGLAMPMLEEASIRRDAGTPVPGFLAVLERRA